MSTLDLPDVYPNLTVFNQRQNPVATLPLAIGQPIKFCMNVINSVLQTHEQLNEEDRIYAANVLCDLSLNLPQLAKFVLHSYKLSNTGRFSLLFNEILDSKIQTRDLRSIVHLAQMSEREAFLELYDNELLTEQERQTIDAMYNREYYAILNSMEYAQQGQQYNVLLPCAANFDQKDSDSLYNQCYQGICIEENASSIFTTATIPNKTYVAELQGDQIQPYCFPIMTLISALAISDGPVINTYTNKPFSARTQQLLYDKYAKEIKMYRRYLRGV